MDNNIINNNFFFIRIFLKIQKLKSIFFSFSFKMRFLNVQTNLLFQTNLYYIKKKILKSQGLVSFLQRNVNRKKYVHKFSH